MGADSTDASRRLSPGSTRIDFWFSCVTAESMLAAPRRVVQAELGFSKEARNNGVAAGSGARDTSETSSGARRSVRISSILSFAERAFGCRLVGDWVISSAGERQWRASWVRLVILLGGPRSALGFWMP